MKKSIFKTLSAAVILATAFSFSSFADDIQIKKINFTCGISDGSMDTGITMPTFGIDPDSGYELSGVEEVNPSSEAYKTQRTYELTFTTEDGYSFAESKDITVKGKDASHNNSDLTITKKTRDNENTLIVRVKAYPYYKWEQPEITDSSGIGDPEGKKIVFTKPKGATVQYCIQYITTSGDVRAVGPTTTTGTSISVTSYNKKYKGSNEDYSDGYVTGIALRCIGDAGENKNTAPSDWTIEGDIAVDDFELAAYESWGDLFETTDTFSGGGGLTTGTSIGVGPVINQFQGWKLINDTWYHYNSAGQLDKGWFYEGGLWYYLDPGSGMMKTGWDIIDFKKYYFYQPGEAGVEGSMAVGNAICEGVPHTFDENGAFIS